MTESNDTRIFRFEVRSSGHVATVEQLSEFDKRIYEFLEEEPRITAAQTDLAKRCQEYVRFGKSLPAAVTREFRLEESRDGLLIPIGGKYTSARADAAGVVDRVLQRLGRPWVSCPTARKPFPWCPPARDGAWWQQAVARGLAAGLDEETAASCATRYGSRLERLLDLPRSEPRLAARIVPDAPFCLAEALHAARHEMARTLEDILLRRIPLLLVARPSERALREVAGLVGPDLDWSEERREHEVVSVTNRPGVALDHETA